MRERLIPQLAAVVLVLAAVVMAIAVCKKRTDVMPLDPAGKPVDWWAIITMPSGVCDRHSHSDPHGGGGCYAYADSNRPSFRVMSGRHIGEPDSPLTATLRQQAIGRVTWNDQASRTSQPGKYTNQMNLAHSKGTARVGARSGFVLNVSTPDFPDPDDERVGFQADNNLLFSQHMFCFSLDRTNMATWSRAIDGIGINILTRRGWPWGLPRGSHVSKDTAHRLRTTGRRSIDMLCKSPLAPFEAPWTAVAELVDDSIRVLSWKTYDAASVAPVCSGRRAVVSTVSRIKLGGHEWCGLGHQKSWRGFRNHAKIAVSEKGDVCVFGSMNDDWTQNRRGGDFYAIRDFDLARSLRSILIASECGEETLHCEGE